MRILNLSRVSFNEVHKFGVLIVFQKCETGNQSARAGMSTIRRRENMR